MFVALAPHRPTLAPRCRERRWRARDGLPLLLAAKATRRKLVLGLGQLCGSSSMPSVAVNRICET